MPQNRGSEGAAAERDFCCTSLPLHCVLHTPMQTHYCWNGQKDQKEASKVGGVHWNRVHGWKYVHRGGKWQWLICDALTAHILKVEQKLNTCFGPCNKFILSTLIERVGQSSFIGQNGPFLVPESCLYDQRGNNTIKSVKHTKTWYFGVSTTFLGYFWLFWSFCSQWWAFSGQNEPKFGSRLIWNFGVRLKFAALKYHYYYINLLYFALKYWKHWGPARSWLIFKKYPQIRRFWGKKCDLVHCSSALFHFNSTRQYIWDHFCPKIPFLYWKSFFWDFKRKSIFDVIFWLFLDFQNVNEP